MKRKILVFAIISSMIIISILPAGCSYFNNVRGLYSDEESGEAAIGNYENNFTLKSLDGDEVSISDFSGSIIVLNFWATWCPPCTAEIPDFIEVYEDYRNNGVQFLGVSNEEAATIKDFVEEYGINYPILVDRSDIFGEWGVRSIPTTFILDDNGTIIYKNVGLMTKSQLETAIEDAL